MVLQFMNKINSYFLFFNSSLNSAISGMLCAISDRYNYQNLCISFQILN